LRELRQQRVDVLAREGLRHGLGRSLRCRRAWRARPWR
jgi:hypothetical protein